jgi:hypothetical protein
MAGVLAMFGRGVQSRLGAKRLDETALALPNPPLGTKNKPCEIESNLDLAKPHASSRSLEPTRSRPGNSRRLPSGPGDIDLIWFPTACPAILV